MPLGLRLLRDGPVADAHHLLLLSAKTLRTTDVVRSREAAVQASLAAWSAGDREGYLAALSALHPPDGSPPTDLLDGSPQSHSPDGSPQSHSPDRTPPAHPQDRTPLAHPQGRTPPAHPQDRTPPADPPDGLPPTHASAGSPPARAPLRADAESPVDAFWRAYSDGMRSVLHGDFEHAASLLRPVLNGLSAQHQPSRLLSAGTIALILGDLVTARQVLGQALAIARSEAVPTLLPRILEHLAYAELRAGRHHQARVHAEAGLEAAAEHPQRNVTAGLSAVLALAASIAGDPAAVAAHAQAALSTAHAHGLSQVRTLAEWARARADLGHGNADHAAARLAPLVGAGPRQGHFGLRMMVVPCYVEAAVLAGHDIDAHPDVAPLLGQYGRWASLGADPQAPAIVLRCRALLAGDEDSEALFTSALAEHEKVDSPYEHARTHLAYGMWLRRRRRPGEARAQLRSAVMGFEHCGADVWTQQADAELRAAGETPTTAPSAASGTPPLPQLTPQQLRIAHSVAQGATNREVARQLSISTRTVEYHLRNIFTQLGVRSRVALARRLEP